MIGEGYSLADKIRKLRGALEDIRAKAKKLEAVHGKEYSVTKVYQKAVENYERELAQVEAEKVIKDRRYNNDSALTGEIDRG